jgi:hypothetical protein
MFPFKIPLIKSPIIAGMEVGLGEQGLLSRALGKWVLWL